MNYFDERGTSRLFEVSIEDGAVIWQRLHPTFSQSVTVRPGDEGDTLVSQGRMAKDGGPWTDDLSQAFRRVG